MMDQLLFRFRFFMGFLPWAIYWSMQQKHELSGVARWWANLFAGYIMDTVGCPGPVRTCHVFLRKFLISTLLSLKSQQSFLRPPIWIQIVIRQINQNFNQNPNKSIGMSIGTQKVLHKSRHGLYMKCMNTIFFLRRDRILYIRRTWPLQPSPWRNYKLQTSPEH